jgi:hypothetical protein
MKVVVVGFKVAEENSVYYRKFEVDSKGDGFGRPDAETAGIHLLAAAAKGAEFVSVRFIR